MGSLSWRRRARRLGRPLSLGLMLLLAVIAPESALVQALTGEGGVEAEVGKTGAFGYYEQLIQGVGSPAPRSSRPAGWLPFLAAGLTEPIPGYLLVRMLPNLDVRWNGTVFRTNGMGYRTPEFTPEKPPGTYRIVVFGSSNTMGHGVDDGEIYVRLLEEWLDERARPARRVEVVNLAVSGDSPSRRLVRMREEAAALDADWLVCDASALDFALEEVQLSSVLRLGIPITLGYVREVVARSGITADDTPVRLRQKLRGEIVPLLEGAFEGWSAEARRLDRPLSVVILPRADDKVSSPKLFALLRTLSTRYGLEYLNLSGALDTLAVEEFRVAPWDQHPSQLGHRMIFEALRDALIERGGPPGLPLESAESSRR